MEAPFSESLLDQLKAGLDRLANEMCWGATAGEGTGSIVNLHIGKKIPRQIPLKNAHLSEDIRKYDSQLGLLIECSWRLDSKSDVTCGWTDSNEEGGPMLSGLQQIVDQKVKRVVLSLPALDLAIEFANSMVLRVFCDRTDPTEDSGNYVLFLPEWTYAVRLKSKLERESRSWA